MRTYTGEINLYYIMKRKVFTEKYNIETEKTNFLLGMLDGCKTFTHSKYPGSIFYEKNNAVLFEKNGEYEHFYVKYSEIWSIFEAKYGMKNSSIQSFVQSRVENLINSEGFTTIRRLYAGVWLENLIKTEWFIA